MEPPSPLDVDDSPYTDWESQVRRAVDQKSVARLERALDPGNPEAQGMDPERTLAPPLLTAVRRCWWDGARLLLAAGAGVNYFVDNGPNALHACAVAPKAEAGPALELARDLLQRGAKPRQQKEGNELIDATVTEAVASGNVELAALLLERNGQATQKRARNRLPLRAVNSARPLEMLTLLATHGARMDVRESGGATLLHRAAALGLAETCAFLCARGVDPTEKDHQEVAPLHGLGASLHPQKPEEGAGGRIAATLQALLAGGAELETRDVIGQTPLCAATDRRRSPLVAAALLDAGASMHARDNAGLTPFHIAAINPSSAHVALFLVRGADTTIQDSNGNTPEQVAAWRGEGDVAQMIRAHVQAQALDAAIAPGQAGSRPRV